MAETTLTSAQVKTIDTSGPIAVTMHKLGLRIQELEQSMYARQYFDVGVPCEQFRAIGGNDVQTIASVAGGVVAINQAGGRLKRINAATNPQWVLTVPSNTATATFEVQADVPLPKDASGGNAMYVYYRARKETAGATASFICITRFNEQSAKSSTVSAITSAYAEYTHTITAATVPATPARMSIVFKQKDSTSAAIRRFISCVRVRGKRTLTSSAGE